ncbi:MAG: type II toxin-antitoxin system RelE/ParE family toxin [Bdellovibrio sp.]|nr:type II toxin-antitoxin system RelE/ParE family toxin [Bdellovibrio sp.]
MKIVWSLGAQTNLQEIGDYIAQDSPDRAFSFLFELIDYAEKVLMFPRAGRKVPETDLDEIREVIHKNYRVVYLMQKHQVLILSVQEGHKMLKVSEICDTDI